ncbi:MAG TPA: TetR/AcrR family transcriptional regulator [Gemmatimonadales bacterium]|jgi:AcrR family transcriptional regulator|nr:TetR/AcrR family transcriptional regulator [Gemmatimonadales bacterium]
MPVSPATPARRRDGEATRQRLIRAALELYTTSGFLGTTTPAIAQRAGVAEGTIYRHFSSKEHLLNEVYRGAQRWALRLVKDSEAERLRTPDRLQHIAHQLCEVADRDPALIRMLMLSRDERFLDEKSREAGREFRAGLQQVLATGKSDGMVRNGPVELWAAVWLALVGLAVERICQKEWTVDQPQVGQTIEAAWDAIVNRPVG